ncbi:MAG: holA [Burkholderiales bacterium]|jgi:DNA polymerase-3 subunit delta|nr:holA [Burkholderiales bacterium]
MLNNNLNKILSFGPGMGNLFFIHVSADDYPLADFVLEQFKTKLNNHYNQYFTADRFFNFSVVEDIINDSSLLDQPNYIQVNFKTKPNAEQQKQLINLQSRLNGQNFLIIICDKLNKTDQNSPWFREFARQAVITGVNTSDAEFLISHLFSSHKLTITHLALQNLINQNQGNLSQLFNEANKLVLAVPKGHLIDVNEIKNFTTDNAQYNIYQLSGKYLAGDLAKSIKILDNLYQEPGDAILIMWVLQEDVKRLLKIKSKMKTVPNIHHIIREMRLWGESVNQLPLAEKRLSYSSLIEIYDDLANLDMAIKGVLDINVKLLLIKIISRLCIVKPN